MGKSTAKKTKRARVTCAGCGVQFEDLEGDRGYCEGCEYKRYARYFCHQTVDGLRIGLILLVMALCGLISDSSYAGEVPDFEGLVEAIWVAEGGERAAVPFGIMSVSCEKYSECREVALNTVRNNWKRWQAGTHGAKDYPDYFSFLASRYAPFDSANWLKNVRYYYEAI